MKIEPGGRNSSLEASWRTCATTIRIGFRLWGYPFTRLYALKEYARQAEFHVNELRGGLTLPSGAAHLPLVLNALGLRVTPPRGCMGVPLRV